MAEERTKPMASKRSASRLGSSVPPTSRSRWRGVRPPATAGWESASSAIAVAPPGASEAGGGSSPRQEPMRCTCPAKPRAWTNNSSTVASPPPGTPTEGCLAPRTERSARRTNRTTRQPRKRARRRRRVTHGGFSAQSTACVTDRYVRLLLAYSSACVAARAERIWQRAIRRCCSSRASTSDT
jgi:hypothetical protein